MSNIKTYVWGIGASLIWLTGINACHPLPEKKIAGDKADPKIKTELEAINQRIENDYQKENADSILGFYDKQFTYLPEYRPPLYETQDLKKFYADWFKSVQIKYYSKKIYEVEDIAGYVLETGNFILRYTTRPDSEFRYTAKYMIMWKRNSAGNLKILSEAFGSDTYIKPEDMPYARVEVNQTRVLDHNILSRQLEPEIEAFDRGVVKAVLTGDGEGRANEFTRDGIYMPHFDPMQSGMEMIRPYMVRTYQPGIIKYVKDSYREIFDTGGFVFLSGHFSVRFDNGAAGEVLKGICPT